MNVLGEFSGIRSCCRSVQFGRSVSGSTLYLKPQETTLTPILGVPFHARKTPEQTKEFHPTRSPFVHSSHHGKVLKLSIEFFASRSYPCPFRFPTSGGIISAGFKAGGEETAQPRLDFINYSLDYHRLG
jgi:hypothetical protein